jgi:nucleoside-diphosphate-sugar epimerase
VYGNSSTYAIDTTNFHLDTPYAINKLHGEYLVRFYHDYHGLNTTVIRYFNSFGPGELPGRYRNVIPNFFARAMQGLVLPITGDEKTSRDFNFIENTVRGTLLAAQVPIAKGRTYNIGSGREVPIVLLAQKINEIAGNAAGIEFRPPRSWDTVKNRCADISVTIRDLQYSPDIDFDRHLRATYEWLKQYQPHFPVV